MLLNTYEPWKFAFSQEETDFNNLKEGAWGIIGVPFDSTTSYHPGSRFGPIVVREASYGFEKYNTIFNLNGEVYTVSNGIIYSENELPVKVMG